MNLQAKLVAVIRTASRTLVYQKPMLRWRMSSADATKTARQSGALPGPLPVPAASACFPGVRDWLSRGVDA